PYLLCITLVTLIAGTLNANGRFAAAAFAPVILNICIVGFLAIAFLFPHAGIAASTGVFAAGILELALLIWVARRAGLFALSFRPGLGADVRDFFKRFGPAVIGAGGVQIALFADTIIGSMLPDGGVSSIYYADRLYQLPIGVIGIAAGTVLLPEMSRRFAANDASGALAAQNRTMGLTILLAAPFFVAFLLIPLEIMRGVFLRGAFTEEAAKASAQVLTAYGSAIFAMVLIRSAVASFQAQGDTKTPMYISLAAVAINLALKIVLFQPLGAVGLALATAAGAWINFLALVYLAHRRGSMKFDAILRKTCLAVAIASVALAMFAIFANAPLRAWAAAVSRFVNETQLLALAAGGGALYVLALGLALMAMRIGPRTLLAGRRSSAPPPDASAPG
ncbi:MAG: lipid II flippase MurJ, partial [Alphaproteobacteria bacterium]|nr:lipid II flippase MurJ [Alphaproteobacteria bacterium]